MKPNVCLLISGAIILTISASFVGRASFKGGITSMYISTSGGGCKWIATNYGNSFTTGGFGAQATLNNSITNEREKVWGSSSCAFGGRPVHFHG